MSLSFLKEFKRQVNKLDNVMVGISRPQEWVSTGNYALNFALTGDWHKGIALGRSTAFVGPSGCLPATETVNLYVFKTDPGLAPKIENENK